MKSETATRFSVVDALTAGLTHAAKRPILWLLPLAIDLYLWLAPGLSITALMGQFVTEWRALAARIYTPEQMAGAQEGIELLAQGAIDMSQGINLASAVTSGWMAPASAMTPIQASRHLLISDAVLAPIGLSIPVKGLGPAPWQGPAVQVGSLLGVVLFVVALWMLSHLVAALYLRAIAHTLSGPKAHGGLPMSRQPVVEDQRHLLNGWLPLAARLAVVSLFASIALFLLRLPLALVTGFALFTGSVVAEFLFMLGGAFTLWLTLWFLSSLYFVGDALAFDRQPLWPSLLQSLLMVRVNGLRTLALAAVVNLLLLGARAMWGLIGVHPAGAFFSIVANAYLATAMVMGIHFFYQHLKQEQLAQASRS